LLKTFGTDCPEIEKWLRSNPGLIFTIYQIGELFENAYKRAATGEIAVNGFRETGLFPCDNFRPHDFPLASEDTDAAPVNHPALVKTRDQPSFSSTNFSPFISAEALRSSDIRPVPSLNLQPNPRGGTVKKITSSPHKEICCGNSGTENHTVHLIQNQSACVECSSWSFKKTEEKGLPGSNFV